jgi:signal transduction histidine kinase/ligand-binding sensor domain-containing protein/DNA-binding response OmpR family regulator
VDVLKILFMIRSLPGVAIILLTLIGVQHVDAQPEQFKFKHLNLNNGLSHPSVRTILKDSHGFVWVGTGLGLNRFDGYTIKWFFHDSRDTTTLMSDGILAIFEAPDGVLVVRTASGLNLYNPAKENFTRNIDSFLKKYGASSDLVNIVRDHNGGYWFVEPDKLIRHHPEKNRVDVITNVAGDSTSIINEAIADFAIDPYGSPWVIHSNGVAEKIQVSEDGGHVVQRITELARFNAFVSTGYKLTFDAEGDLWLCAPWLNQGVFYYTFRDGKLTQISTNTSPLKLNTRTAWVMAHAPDGTMWIGTDHGGLNIVDKERLTVRYVRNRDGDATSIAENSITSLYKDEQGIMWLGTYKRGVSYYHKNIFRFDIYRRYALDPGSLPFEDVNEFAEDAKGNLWIGTNGGGLIYFDRARERFTQYLNEPGNENSLSANVIVSLCLDKEQNLWIGTYSGGLNKFDGKKFTRYRHIEGDSLSLPSQNIWEVFEDSRKRLWIGTIEAGAALFDKLTGKFHRVRLWGPNAMQSVTVEVIDEDRHGNIWFGTNNGIDVLAKDGKTFTHYASSADSLSLSHHSVLDILRDARGRMWIATFDGLNLFDEASGGFTVYRHDRIHNAVVALQEDNYGHLWMATIDGLLEATATDQGDGLEFKRYTESDGLQGRQFNHNAGFRTRVGELVFGGPTGFNILNTRERKLDLPITRIILSDLQLYEQGVAIGQEISGVVVLDKSISEARKIVLPPDKNFFSIRFSALNFINPEHDRYMYKLDGLNTDWLTVDPSNPQVVFNSLNPGTYTLRVKAANRDGVWSQNEAMLTIIMKPPFWKTNLAFVIYAVMLVLALVLTRRTIQQREKIKFMLQQERHEAQRIHELDMLKVKFFTNISHEFRTPLSLILTPIERLIRKATDADQLSQFQLIQRNGRRLMNLVNQLLDFKKLEVHDIKFSPSKGDIVAFTNDTAMSFSDLSEKKNIRLEFQSSVTHFDTLFDQDKLEKILFNLLSNAFKFTLENGVVSVRLAVISTSLERFIQIEVTDTGIGIAREKFDLIFEPFFQSDLPKSIINVGSGIGLAITKEFVRIHGGSIAVESEVGKGSSFRVTIPVIESGAQHNDPTPQDAEIGETDNNNSENTDQRPVHPDESVAAKSVKKSLLLVEDNDDFRFYLKDNLKFLYTIHEATNGAQAWTMILEFQPDLIISDVMMPDMNGIELCTKIKTDQRISHIPVILLTARSSDEQRLEGIRTGADDYITKPFNFEVLEARIENLLRRREKSQKAFRDTMEVKSSELQITPLDVKFVDNAVKFVEKNVSASGFSVEDLAMGLGISRAYVFKKIMALTGKTPLEFIRTIRLQHAAQLLEKSQLSVREIAYKVGFNNPKYFTKYFKEHFGVLPSEFNASKKNSEDAGKE